MGLGEALFYFTKVMLTYRHIICPTNITENISGFLLTKA